MKMLHCNAYLIINGDRNHRNNFDVIEMEHRILKNIKLQKIFAHFA